MERYAKILDMKPVMMHSFYMSIQRQEMWPVILTGGPDQAETTSAFRKRSESGVVRNYKNLAVELCGLIPDVLGFFITSLVHMEKVVSTWYEMVMIRKLLEPKLVFIEMPDSIEFTLALD